MAAKPRGREQKNWETPADIKKVLGSTTLSVGELYRIYDQRQPVPEGTDEKSARKVASRQRQIPWLQADLLLALEFTKCALEQEEFLLLCDVAREACRFWTGQNDQQRIQLAKIRMNFAAALTRLGFRTEAQEQLVPLVDDKFEPRLDPQLRADIFVQLGNILREQAGETSAEAAQRQIAEDALKYYRLSLGEDPDRLRTLALTAAASLVIGAPGSALREEAFRIAKQLIKRTSRKREAKESQFYHVLARATAYAVLGAKRSAIENYRKLQHVKGVKTTDLAEARYYASVIAQATGAKSNPFKRAFPKLQLIVFAGHMPDLPNKPVRFPLKSLARIRKTIRDKVNRMGAKVALCSAAAGADLLFIEAMLDRGGTVHVVLPWTREEFLKTSVRPYEPVGGKPIWEPLFNRVLARAATVREIGQAFEPASDVGWDYTLEVTAGLALHTARVCRLDVQPLVLWDGEPGWGNGSTARFYQFWHDKMGNSPEQIKLPIASTGRGSQRVVAEYRRCETQSFHQEVKSMMFADIVGYSKLPEVAIRKFVEPFLRRVSQLMASSKSAPTSINTWGDGVYAVFDSTRSAGVFALELAQLVLEGENDWKADGLYSEEIVPGTQEVRKNTLNIRVGLHTGPVFMHYDPVVRRLGFTGSHVSRAARIEPITKVGEVFASEEFAALAEVDAELARNGEEPAGFVCEYAGSKQLAKDYPGWFRLYRVVPKRIFAIEELARAAHEFFLEAGHHRGETSAHPAMRPWESLSEDLKRANRAQVGDIPNKLRLLGYELSPSYGLAPMEISMTVAQVEDLAIREHDRWMAERKREGWTYAPKRDNSRKHHPLLVPWKLLSEPERQKDRDTVMNLPRLIERAGFRVRKKMVP